MSQTISQTLEDHFDGVPNKEAILQMFNKIFARRLSGSSGRCPAFINYDHAHDAPEFGIYYQPIPHMSVEMINQIGEPTPVPDDRVLLMPTAVILYYHPTICAHPLACVLVNNKWYCYDVRQFDFARTRFQDVMLFVDKDGIAHFVAVGKIIMSFPPMDLMVEPAIMGARLWRVYGTCNRN